MLFWYILLLKRGERAKTFSASGTIPYGFRDHHLAEAKLSFLDARERIKAMLKEYVGSGDLHEVERQLSSLNAPFVHHEVVKQALMMATDDMKSCSVRASTFQVNFCSCKGPVK
jgi:hypothetical protein